MTQERRQRPAQSDESSQNNSEQPSDEVTELLGALGRGLMDLSREPNSPGRRKARTIARLFHIEEEEREQQG